MVDLPVLKPALCSPRMFFAYDSELRCVIFVRTYRLSIIKQFLCSYHNSVYNPYFGWDKLNFASRYMLQPQVRVIKLLVAFMTLFLS
jgi:hypothetical protein